MAQNCFAVTFPAVKESNKSTFDFQLALQGLRQCKDL